MKDYKAKVMFLVTLVTSYNDEDYVLTPEQAGYVLYMLTLHTNEYSKDNGKIHAIKALRDVLAVRDAEGVYQYTIGLRTAKHIMDMFFIRYTGSISGKLN